MLGSLCPRSQAPTSPRSPPGGGGFSDVPGLDAGPCEQLGGHPSPGVRVLGPWLVSVNRHRQAAAQPPLPLLHPPAPPASLRTASVPRQVPAAHAWSHLLSTCGDSSGSSLVLTMTLRKWLSPLPAEEAAAAPGGSACPRSHRPHLL